jgi:hypothetical protein
VLNAVKLGNFKLVDNMIMGADVSVGSMVILVGKEAPEWGFVCANGNEWIPRKLRRREANAIMYDRGMGK